jgi:hypothetical protein
VFTETGGGTATDRPTLNQLRPGDALVVWKLDGWAGLEPQNR